MAGAKKKKKRYLGCREKTGLSVTITFPHSGLDLLDDDDFVSFVEVEVTRGVVDRSGLRDDSGEATLREGEGGRRREEEGGTKREGEGGLRKKERGTKGVRRR
jgi:hypothetical protein